MHLFIIHHSAFSIQHSAFSVQRCFEVLMAIAAEQPVTKSDLAVSVRRLSKVYRVRSAPEKRWVSLVLPQIGRAHV